MEETRARLLLVTLLLFGILSGIGFLSIRMVLPWPKSWRRAMRTPPFAPANDGRYAAILAELDRVDDPRLAAYRAALARAMESNAERDCHVAYGHYILLSRNPKGRR